MGILLLNLCVVYIYSLLAEMRSLSEELENNHSKFRNFFIFIALLALILVSGLRYGVGTDYFTYYEMYKYWVPKADITTTSDPGFIILCKLLYSISPNPQLMFLVTSIITNILIVVTLKRHSYDFPFSMYLYVTTFTYYATFNGLRQSMSVAITFIGLKYLIERDWKKYFGIVLLASMFHQSSLIMIPVYFIVNHKFISKKSLIIFTFFLGVLIFYNGFLNSLFIALQGSNYEGYKEVVSESGNGAHIFRFLVQLLPMIIIFIFYKRIPNYESKEVNIIINLSFLGLLFMMLSLKHWLFARIATPFNMYYLLLIPMLLCLSNVNAKTNRFFYYVIIVCYFSYSYVLLRSGESNILPYYWNWELF